MIRPLPETTELPLVTSWAAIGLQPATTHLVLPNRDDPRSDHLLGVEVPFSVVARFEAKHFLRAGNLCTPWLAGV